MATESTPPPNSAKAILRPTWDVIVPQIGSFFESSEELEMYHMAAVDTLYEKGGLNHPLEFFLTALAFRSVDRPDAQVVLCYQPSNMTVSLLPIISEDGLSVVWAHQGASTVFATAIDSDYWTSASYLASTTGSMFSAALHAAELYQFENPRYQPFSVYKTYLGVEFVAATSCDEFVWNLVQEANSRGVPVVPSILPKKIKIAIYSSSEPEVISIDGESDTAVAYRSEVVSFYRSLAVCLQTRKYSYITTLSDFAKYFDCLDTVAYIGLDQSDYLRVNLTSSVMDHVVVPATLPDVPLGAEPLTYSDLLLILCLLIMIGSGFSGLLWRGQIPQHFSKRFRHLRNNSPRSSHRASWHGMYRRPDSEMMPREDTDEVAIPDMILTSSHASSPANSDGLLLGPRARGGDSSGSISVLDQRENVHTPKTKLIMNGKNADKWKAYEEER